jgi:hypothetical protein
MMRGQTMPPRALSPPLKQQRRQQHLLLVVWLAWMRT